MLIELEALPEQPEPADVIVVGAGAVGILTAIRLARAGLRTLLLEAGGSDVNAGSQRYFDNATSVGVFHEGLHTGRFRALGGTTNFWGGQLARFDAHLFGPRPWVGEEAGWPIAAADLDPYYREVLAMLGMAGAVFEDEELLGKLRQPMPALPDELRHFFTRWTPQPNFAILFEQELRASETLYCVLNAPVTGLAVDASGRVTHVECRTEGGTPHPLAARHVILANGTIEIARLLMLPPANGGAAPWSGNPWLGRGFMDHIDLVGGEIHPIDAKRFHDAFENVAIGGIKYQPKIKLSADTQAAQGLGDVAAHFLFNSSYAEHFVNAKIFLRSFMRGRLGSDWRNLPSRIAALLRVGGPLVLRYLRYRRVHSPADRGITLRLAGEQVVMRESGIRLRDECDDLGMPMVDLDWRIDGREIETFARFAQAIAKALEDAGLATVELDPDLIALNPAVFERIDVAHHQMGMCRMAAGPGDGVVDSDCAVFGTPNLSVAGAATFRATGFPNPTFTALALGLRIAKRLIDGRAA